MTYVCYLYNPRQGYFCEVESFQVTPKSLERDHVQTLCITHHLLWKVWNITYIIYIRALWSQYPYGFLSWVVKKESGHESNLVFDCWLTNFLFLLKVSGAGDTFFPNPLSKAKVARCMILPKPNQLGRPKCRKWRSWPSVRNTKSQNVHFQGVIEVLNSELTT